MPSFIKKEFEPFNTSMLNDLFCVRSIYSAPGVKNISSLKAAGRDVYIGGSFWTKDEYRKLWPQLPPFDEDLMVDELALHAHHVLGALWGNIKPVYQEALIQILSKNMSNTVNYTSVHKRSFEGGCHDWVNWTRNDNIMNNGEYTVDKSSLPPKWATYKHFSCDMPMAMVDDIYSHYHPLSPDAKPIIHLAWDGQDSVEDYKSSLNRVFIGRLNSIDAKAPNKLNISQLDARGAHDRRALAAETTTDMRSPKPLIAQLNTSRLIASPARRNTSSISTKGVRSVHQVKRVTGNATVTNRPILSPNFLDMLVAIHSELFVMNPMSTWSWAVAVPRMSLGLALVPEYVSPPVAGILMAMMYHDDANSSVISYEAVWSRYLKKVHASSMQVRERAKAEPGT